MEKQEKEESVVGKPEKKLFPEAEEMRAISGQNSRRINGYTGYSRSRSLHQRYVDPGEDRGHFALRLMISLLLFAGFCFMAKDDRTIGRYDSGKIKEVIQEDTDLEAVLETLKQNSTLAVFSPSGL